MLTRQSWTTDRNLDGQNEAPQVHAESKVAFETRRSASRLYVNPHAPPRLTLHPHAPLRSQPHALSHAHAPHLCMHMYAPEFTLTTAFMLIHTTVDGTHLHPLIFPLFYELIF